MKAWTPTHPVWMELDLEALEANYHEIRRRIGRDVKLVASIKADGYGHGAVEVARRLTRLGVYALATGSFADAVAIRQAGIDARILMFGGCTPEGVRELQRHSLIPTVHTMELARAASASGVAPAPVYIKVDCGLGRLGVPLALAEDFAKEVAALPNIVVEGLYTHLPFSDASGRDWARQRLAAFYELVATLAASGLEIPVTQALSSAGIIAGLKNHCSAVCPGHLLYGISPVLPDIADAAPFRPVLRSIKAQLIHVGHHAGQWTAGVGGYYPLESGSTIGVVPLGLNDGYRNPAKGRTAAVLLRGRRVPVIGVSLEHTTIDLSAIEHPAVGEEVSVLGGAGTEAIGLPEMAESQGVRPIDVLMAFSRRLPRSYHPPPLE